MCYRTHFLITKEALRNWCFWNVTKKMLIIHFPTLLGDVQAHPVYSLYPSEAQIHLLSHRKEGGCWASPEQAARFFQEPPSWAALGQISSGGVCELAVSYRIWEAWAEKGWNHFPLASGEIWISPTARAKQEITHSKSQICWVMMEIQPLVIPLRTVQTGVVKSLLKQLLDKDVIRKCWEKVWRIVARVAASLFCFGLQ